jgi:hypothetical protein
MRPDVPAKPAVVVGLAQARGKKKPGQVSQPPPSVPSSTRGPKRTAPPPVPARPRAPLPKPFDEPTRNVNESELLAAVRGAPSSFDDLPTRLGENRLFDDGAIDDGLSTLVGDSPKFLGASTIIDEPDQEATRLAHIDNISPGARSQNPARGDERTRAVDIRGERGDRRMSDVDWDID